MKNSRLKARVLGLDVGAKRIGVAISDPLGLIAQGLDTLSAENSKAVLQSLRHLIQQYSVARIIVGLPLLLNGTEGTQAQKVRAFIEMLRKKLGAAITIETWDERLSSQAAERLLLEADLSRARRRQVRDKLAAAWILQAYLDSQTRSCSNDSSPPS